VFQRGGATIGEFLSQGALHHATKNHIDPDAKNEAD
jgi:hypothetical protein